MTITIKTLAQELLLDIRAHQNNRTHRSRKVAAEELQRILEGDCTDIEILNCIDEHRMKIQEADRFSFRRFTRSTFLTKTKAFLEQASYLESSKFLFPELKMVDNSLSIHNIKELAKTLASEIKDKSNANQDLEPFKILKAFKNIVEREKTSEYEVYLATEILKKESQSSSFFKNINDTLKFKLNTFFSLFNRMMKNKNSEDLQKPVTNIIFEEKPVSAKELSPAEEFANNHPLEALIDQRRKVLEDKIAEALSTPIYHDTFLPGRFGRIVDNFSGIDPFIIKFTPEIKQYRNAAMQRQHWSEENKDLDLQKTAKEEVEIHDNLLSNLKEYSKIISNKAFIDYRSKLQKLSNVSQQEQSEAVKPVSPTVKPLKMPIKPEAISVVLKDDLVDLKDDLIKNHDTAKYEGMHKRKMELLNEVEKKIKFYKILLPKELLKWRRRHSKPNMFNPNLVTYVEFFKAHKDTLVKKIDNNLEICKKSDLKIDEAQTKNIDKQLAIKSDIDAYLAIEEDKGYQDFWKQKYLQEQAKKTNKTSKGIKQISMFAYESIAQKKASAFEKCSKQYNQEQNDKEILLRKVALKNYEKAEANKEALKIHKRCFSLECEITQKLRMHPESRVFTAWENYLVKSEVTNLDPFFTTFAKEIEPLFLTRFTLDEKTLELDEDKYGKLPYEIYSDLLKREEYKKYLQTHEDIANADEHWLRSNYSAYLPKQETLPNTNDSYTKELSRLGLGR